MAFVPIDAPGKVKRPKGERATWIAPAIALICGALMLAFATLPYDAWLGESDDDYDVIDQMPLESGVTSPADVARVYPHLDKTARQYVSVDAQGRIHFRQARPAQPKQSEK